jgi:hypothetical protein
MRRFGLLVGAALLAIAAPAQAQVIGVQITRPYTPIVVRPNYLPPVYVNPPGMFNTYPLIAPNYASTLNIYPQVPVTYSYFAPPAGFPLVVPAPGIYSYSFSSSTGFGPFGSSFSLSQVFAFP